MEYKTMGRQFAGEKRYTCLPVMFLSRKWNLMLGAVHGQLYKIALSIDLRKEWQANAVAEDTLLYCTTALGPPAEEGAGLFAWDARDGNVIMQMAEVGGIYALSLFLTSSCVRSFR
jgi:hypothetical protein